MQYIQTTTSVRDSFSRPYRCSGCGFEATASVVAEGTGRSAGSEMHGAIADANAVASRTLLFVQCPQCGVRPDAGRVYKRQVRIGVPALGLLSALVGGGFIAALTDANDRLETGLYGGVFLGGMLGLATYWVLSRPWQGAADRVRLTPIPPAPWSVPAGSTGSGSPPP